MRRQEWIYLAALALALNLFALSNHGLFEPDEGRYASMALEWLEFDQNDWLEPMLSDVGHYDKPPLVYWLTGASFLTFGKNEFAARFPSLLGGMLTLAGAGLLAGRQYGPRAAFVAVFACMTTLHFWALSHLLSPDMLLCGFCTLGAALVLWGKRKTPLATALTWTAGACCWILAWWTKATAALVPLIAIYGALWIAGRKDLRASLKMPLLLGMILLFGAPWYLLMMKRHPELVDFFFFREAVGRVSGHVHGRRGIFGYHFAVLAVFWLPWWPVVAIRHYRDTGGWGMFFRKIRGLGWEAWAALMVVMIYSLVSSKLITYILPGLPLQMIAVAKILAPGMTLRPPARFLKTGWAMVALFTVVGLVVPRVEHLAGRNSSVRLAVSEAAKRGAEILIFDRHFAGAEFYFPGRVWYAGIEAPLQASQVKGQDLERHFIPRESVVKRVEESGCNVWLIRWRKVPEAWQLELMDRAKRQGSETLQIGVFHVEQVNRAL